MLRQQQKSQSAVIRLCSAKQGVTQTNTKAEGRMYPTSSLLKKLRMEIGINLPSGWICKPEYSQLSCFFIFFFTSDADPGYKKHQLSVLWRISLSAVNHCAFKMQVWNKLRKNDSANVWDAQITVRYQCTYTSLRIQTWLIAQKVILFTVDFLQVSLFFIAGFCAFWDTC